MTRRLPFALACVAGTVLLVVPIAASEVAAARAGDRVVRMAAPLMTRASLLRLRADLGRLEAAAAALRDAPPPSSPSVKAALAGLPTVQRQAELVVGNLERRRGQFDSLAALPGYGLTPEQAVWVVLAIGAALLSAGLAGLVRPRRWLVAVLAGTGVILLAAPLAVGYPAKASDTDALVGSLRPFSVQKVRAREAGLAVARAVLDGYGAQQLPQASVEETNAALDRFAAFVAFSRRAQPIELEADRLSATTMSWLLVLPGVALTLAGAGFLYSWSSTGRRPIGR